MFGGKRGAGGAQFRVDGEGVMAQPFCKRHKMFQQWFVVCEACFFHQASFKTGDHGVL